MGLKVKLIKSEEYCNTYVVTDGKTTIIIDAGATPEKLKKILNKRKPSAILQTHAHYDHVYYADTYRSDYNCPIYAPDSEDEITVGTIDIKPILAPGHSSDSVLYLIENHLFTGDVLFDEGIGRTDLTSGDEKSMQKSLKKLLNVKFKMAYHGHDAPSKYKSQIENIKANIKQEPESQTSSHPDENHDEADV